MKSIIEQASSIMKAIEKAWNQAEQPKEFSIKIFEKEERNFFGMSVKPAKVGIFFGDKPAIHEKSSARPRTEIRECRPEARDHKIKKISEDRSRSENRLESNIKRPHPAINRPLSSSENRIKTAKTDTVSEKPHRISAYWNETMVTSTHDWIKKILSLTNMTIDFNSEVMGKNLKLTFNAPLAADPLQEKQLFRSFAHLIMSSLRNQYKQEIKDLKVILTRPE
jgi:predicted RNA-binding protein Jag